LEAPVPNAVTAAIITTAINAAISAYSIAVTARLSFLILVRALTAKYTIKNLF